MKQRLPCLRAERIKIHRTLAFAMTFIAPAAIIVLVLAMYTRHPAFYIQTAESSAWKLLGENVLVYWSLLMLPLFITIESALLGNLEHSQKNWKMIFTLPVRRSRIYLAKLITSIELIALSMVILFGMLLLLGAGLQIYIPEFGFDFNIPWCYLGKLFGLSFLASWLLISFHLWLSVRTPNFVLAISVGIIATILGLFIFGEDFAAYYPWTIPGTFSIDMAQKSITQLVSLGIGWLGSILFAILAMVDIQHRDVL